MVKRILMCLVVVMASLSVIVPASGQVVDPLQEVLVELEPNENPSTFAPYYLSVLDVGTQFQCQKQTRDDDCRIGHIYEHALNGFSVFLTQWELQKAQRTFTSDSVGIHSMMVSTPLSLPVIDESIQAVGNEIGLMSNEIVPYNIMRAGGGTEDASNTAVAVIDTGVAVNHPDLNIHPYLGVDCTWGQEVDGLPAYQDRHGHGTHVSATIGAKINGMGVVGGAPGAQIVPVKVLNDQGQGNWASLACGLDYVAEHSDVIRVANMSLGGAGYIDACGGADALRNAACVVAEKTILVVAAGNSSQPISGFSPANFEFAITVTALADFDGRPGGAGLMPAARCSASSVDDMLSSFSNYGSGADFAASGVCVLSATPPVMVNGNLVPTWSWASGTSMSSPTAASCLVLYMSQNPDQFEHAISQVTAYSKSFNDPLQGDRDDYREPIIKCGAPRYEG